MDKLYHEQKNPSITMRDPLYQENKQQLHDFDAKKTVQSFFRIADTLKKELGNFAISCFMSDKSNEIFADYIRYK